LGYSTSGAGYDGFGSFESFIPLAQTPGKDLLYLMGRFLLDNDANLGGNLLVGYRFYNPGANRVYGGYLAYDNRDTGFKVFSQLGLGFETLGTGWDARINAYLPVGNTRQTVRETLFSTGTQISSTRFQDHYLLASGTRQQQRIREMEAAMAGFDAEIGGKLFGFGNGGEMRGYGGLYYLSGGESSLGVRGRLEVRPTDYLTVGLGVQHDGIFGTNVVATVGLTFPGSRPKGSDATSVLARMGEFPARNGAIAVDRQRQVSTTSTAFTDTALLNPSTGQPYYFQHVTLGNSGGNGTFESPFGQVQLALNATRSDGNDIVYVQAGTNPGIPAFTIPNRVQVLSTGPVQTIPGQLAGQSFPQFPLPLSGSGTYPRVTNTVTMGSDTILSGFAITSPIGPGVTFNNVNSVQIRDNRIANTGDSGILGNGVANATLLRNTITAARNQGVYLQNVGTANVTDNTVTNTIAGTTNLSNPITGDITIPNPLGGSITIPNPGSIIPLPSGQGIVIGTITGSANILRNAIAGTATQGIVVLNSQGSLAVNNNTVSNTVGNDVILPIPNVGNVAVPSGQGIVISGTNGTTDISSNTVSNTRGQGIAIAAVQGTTTVNNNTVQQASDQGIVVAGTSGTTTLTNNQIRSTATRIITVPTLPTIGGGPYNFPTGQGVAIINALGTVNLTSNVIENTAGAIAGGSEPSSGQGVLFASFSGQTTLNITNNQIRNSFNDGILVGLGGTSSPANLNLSITNNLIENSGGATPIRGDGIGIGVEQAATIPSLLIENNTIRGNGDEGIDIRLATTANALSPSTASITGSIRSNTISTPALTGSSGQNGIQVEARSNSVAKLALESNTITVANSTFRAIQLTTVNNISIGGTPRISADVRLNQLTGNTTPAFLAQTNTLLSQILCVNLSGNNSNTGYSLTRNMGTLQVVNLANVGTNNTGTVIQTGILTSVTACP
jgi:hypothetical protein